MQSQTTRLRIYIVNFTPESSIIFHFAPRAEVNQVGVLFVTVALDKKISLFSGRPEKKTIIQPEAASVK